MSEAAVVLISTRVLSTNVKSCESAQGESKSSESARGGGAADVVLRISISRSDVLVNCGYL